MSIATVVVTICLAAMFLFAGSIKLLGVQQSLAIRDHLGISPTQWRGIGLLELAGVAGALAGLAWRPIGLAAAIEWQAADFQRRTKIRCEVATSFRRAAPDRDVSTAVFRMVQEALTNAARHARATRVRIDVRESDGHLLVEVADDGRGITEAQRSGLGSLGLLGMRERARLLGGELTISGGPGRGTRITARVPVALATGS